MSALRAPIRVDPLDRANAALTAAQGDREDAWKRLIAMANNDSELREAIQDGTLEKDCWNWIKRAERAFKSALWAQTRPGATGSVRVLNLYHYTLTSGIPLGDATKADLDESIKVHRSHRLAAARDEWFLSAVRKQVGDGVVRDRLTQEQLGAFFSEAQQRSGQ